MGLNLAIIYKWLKTRVNQKFDMYKMKSEPKITPGCLIEKRADLANFAKKTKSVFYLRPKSGAKQQLFL